MVNDGLINDNHIQLMNQPIIQKSVSDNAVHNTIVQQSKLDIDYDRMADSIASSVSKAIAPEIAKQSVIAVNRAKQERIKEGKLKALRNKANNLDRGM